MVSQLNKLIVQEYTEHLKKGDDVVLLTINDLTVQETQNLRTEVRATGAALKVTKIRLANVAFKEMGLPVAVDVTASTTGLLVGDTEATLAAAKAIELIAKADKDSRRIHFTGAFLDGDAMSAKQAALIPAMPDRHTLRGMFASLLAGPARMLATVLREIPASTARVIQARAGEGDA